jgi:hypothetical protein
MFQSSLEKRVRIKGLKVYDKVKTLTEALTQADVAYRECYLYYSEFDGWDFSDFSDAPEDCSDKQAWAYESFDDHMQWLYDEIRCHKGADDLIMEIVGLTWDDIEVTHCQCTLSNCGDLTDDYVEQSCCQDVLCRECADRHSLTCPACGHEYSVLDEMMKAVG